MSSIFIDKELYSDLEEEEIRLIDYMNNLNTREWMYEGERTFNNRRMFYFVKKTKINTRDITRITFSFDKNNSPSSVLYFTNVGIGETLEIYTEEKSRKEMVENLWNQFKIKFGLRLRLLFSGKEQI